MCKIKGIFTFLLIFFLFSAYSQQKYWVYFTDKKNVSFDPYQYFDQKAIDRRIKNNIPLNEVTDFPLNQDYVESVGKYADSLGFQSRWFNAAIAYISNIDNLEKIESFEFVKKVEPVLSSQVYYSKMPGMDVFLSSSMTQLMKDQTDRMGGELFENNSIDGKGVRIAVFDGGFPFVDEHYVFEHLRDNKQIVKTWDFVKDKEFVYYGNDHGRMTLTCIGGISNGIKLGLATGAEFMLAKTEIGLEPYSEEEHWMAAAEWADKNGADIINSSLGYGYQRYFTSDMDGKTSLVVKAANMAAKKGILVVNSAGNEGDGNWTALITPADGDSVLAIGGIDPETDLRIGFSSYGPTADNRMKPNVSAYGHVVSASEKGMQYVDGTSFSSPLVAGFAACALQSKPDLTNMELFHEIEKSGHLYPYFDYSHGFGIPQASYFLNGKIEPKKTFEIVDSSGFYKIVLKPEVINDQNWIQGNQYLYYNYMDKKGIVYKTFVIRIERKEALIFDKDDFSDGNVINIHFRGYTDSIKF